MCWLCWTFFQVDWIGTTPKVVKGFMCFLIDFWIDLVIQQNLGKSGQMVILIVTKNDK
jgi:hypothetical protein